MLGDLRVEGLVVQAREFGLGGARCDVCAYHFEPINGRQIIGIIHEGSQIPNIELKLRHLISPIQPPISISPLQRTPKRIPTQAHGILLYLLILL